MSSWKRALRSANRERRRDERADRRRGKAREREALAAAREFNLQHPVGTPVRVYPGTRDGRHIDTVTRSEAQVTAAGDAVVWVEGRPGCIALTHVDVREEDNDAA